MDILPQEQIPPSQDSLPSSLRRFSFSKKYVILLVVFIFLIIGIIVGSILLPTFKNKTTVSEKDEVAISSPKPFPSEQWVNCHDVRRVLEENGKLYVGCLGGVLIVEKATGKTIDEISMADGLSDSTVTDLIKRNDTLYIGTQNGFTLYDLKKRTTKRVTPEEGLVNGANTLLALEGSTVWVGTFDGVSQYDTVSGELTNYRTELLAGSTSFGTGGILVTPKAVYVSINSNAYSSGGVTRFDLKTRQWKAQPGINGSLSSVSYFGDTVYVNGWGMIHMIEDEDGADWTSMTELSQELGVTSNDLRFLVIGKDLQGLYITTKDSFNYYNPQTKTVKKLTVPQEVINSLQGQLIPMDKDTYWYRKPDGWLAWINVKTNEHGDVLLLDRPIAFNKITAVIDGDPIIGDATGLWKYHGTQKKFTQLLAYPSSLDPDSSYELQPIIGTSKALVYGIACGQGCTETALEIYDFTTEVSKQLSMEDAEVKRLSDKMGAHVSSESIYYDSYNRAEKYFRFSTGYGSPGYVTLSTDTLQWDVILHTPSPTVTDALVPLTPYCNPVYTFKSTRNLFSEKSCPVTFENTDYAWEILGVYQNRSIRQIDKKTRQAKLLKLPLTSSEISPFTNQREERPVGITAVGIIDQYLWLETNAGLIRYSPGEDTVSVIDGKNGLASDEVTGFAVDGKTLWVSTHWGGLSRVTLTE